MLAVGKLFLASLFALALLAAPGTAGAQTGTTYYVDDSGLSGGTGDDANDCTQPVAGAPGIGPCATIARAINVATDGATIQVDNGSFAGSHLIEEDLTITAQDFVAADGAGATFVTSFGGDTFSVADGASFRILGDPLASYLSISAPTNASGVAVTGSAEIAGNVFQLNHDNETGVSVNDPDGSVTIEDNSFAGVGDDSLRVTGVSVGATSQPITIEDNGFFSLSDGVFVGGASTPAISDNEFSGTHVVQPGGTGGRAITVVGGNPTISDNLIESPDPDTGALGIDVANVGSDPEGATLRRNQIFGHVVGVNVHDARLPVTLDGDLIASGGYGVQATDASPLGNEANVSATNVTLFDTGSDDFSLSDVALTLDSSLVEDPIGENAGSTNDCEISFSRGPTTSGGDCETFQTSAVPGFVNQGSGDYRLAPSSPLIDTGNPAMPTNPFDFEGHARLLDGDATCPLDRRRDIGADEVAGREPSCPTPASNQASAEDPQCATLRDRLAKLTKRIKQASDPDRKKALKQKRRKVRNRLKALGCP